MSWLIYFKAIVELIAILFIGFILIYFVFQEKKEDENINFGVILTLSVLIIVLIFDAFFLRESAFKIVEGLDNVENDNTENKDLTNDFDKRTNEDYNNLSNGYLDGKILRIKEIKGVESISGKAYKDIFDSLYPVGTILIMEKNPKETLKFGEWELLNNVKKFKDLRYLSLVSPGYNNIKDLGGLANVNLTQENIPYHDHTIFTEQTTGEADYHKVFKYESPSIKLQLDSISRDESKKIGKENCTDPECIRSKNTIADDQFNLLNDKHYFMYNVPHSNISPFIAVNVWVRNK